MHRSAQSRQGWLAAQEMLLQLVAESPQLVGAAAAPLSQGVSAPQWQPPALRQRNTLARGGQRMVLSCEHASGGRPLSLPAEGCRGSAGECGRRIAGGQTGQLGSGGADGRAAEPKRTMAGPKWPPRRGCRACCSGDSNSSAASRARCVTRFACIHACDALCRKYDNHTPHR